MGCDVRDDHFSEFVGGVNEMSYEDGWAALNLEMPKRVPRTEFSAHDYHFELVKAVTGIEVDVESAVEDRIEACQAFVRAWNYDILFWTQIEASEFGDMRTNMGHAAYAFEGADYDDKIYCPFKDPSEVLAFDPWDVYGERDKRELTRRFREFYRWQCAIFPTNVNPVGIYISLITGLTYIFGWEMMLLAAGMDPEGFGELTNRYTSWIQQYYDALAEAEVPVVWSHDDMVWTEGAIFHPDWYRKYVFPNYKKLWEPLIESGTKIIYVCDGDYTQFVEDVAACGAHGFWFEVFTDMTHVAERYGQTHALIGNVDTRVLLNGTREQIRTEVERCMAIGKKCPGYFIAVSNHIPPNTPVKNALYYNEVYDELCWR